jgi:hypothetical protein
MLYGIIQVSDHLACYVFSKLRMACIRISGNLEFNNGLQ